MKKLLLIVVLLGSLTVFAFPLGIFGQQMQINDCCLLKYQKSNGKGGILGTGTIVGSPNSSAATCSYGNPGYKVPNWAMFCTLDTIENITNWAFTLLLLIATLFIIIAGFFFVTAQGEPDKITSARNFVFYALIGVLVATLSRGVVTFIQKIVG